VAKKHKVYFNQNTQRLSYHFIAFIFLYRFIYSCGGGETSAPIEFIHQDSLSLIPQPMNLEKRENSFKIDFETHINYSTDLEAEGNYPR